MASKDPFRIKARAADLGITMQDICHRMRAEEGVEAYPSHFARARNNDVKTAGDWRMLNAADAVLRRLEAASAKA